MLVPEKDRAAQVGLAAYAWTTDDSELRDDLFAWLAELELLRKCRD